MEFAKSRTAKISGLFTILVGLIVGHSYNSSEAYYETNYSSSAKRSTLLGNKNFLNAQKDIELNIADPAISQMWGLKSINASKAFTNVKALGSKEIKVAIIDTGIDVNHPDLQRNLWVNKGEQGKDNLGRDKATNNIDDDKNGCVDDVHGCNMITLKGNLKDNHGHGTHIAGIIGATRGNGIGISGVVPNVSLMIVKYYDPAAPGINNLMNTVKAIEYAVRNGANIINYSGGGLEPSPAEKRAIRKAQRKGILFVAAAGNERSNSDTHGYYPADYKLDNIISVTAIDKSKNVLQTSNYGKASVDLAAPGKNILSTLPNGKYGKMTGTSQATAFVTGVAALIMAKFRGLTPKQVISHLTQTGDLDSKLSGKTIYKKRLNTYRALTILDQGVSATGIIASNTQNLGKSFTVGSANTTKASSSLNLFGAALKEAVKRAPNSKGQ